MGKSPPGSGTSRKLLRAAGRAQGSNPDRKLQTRPADQEVRAEPWSGPGSWGLLGPPSWRTGCSRHAQRCGVENGCAVPEEGRPNPVQSLPLGGDPSLRTLRMAVPEAGWTVPAPRLLGAPDGCRWQEVRLIAQLCSLPSPVRTLSLSLASSRARGRAFWHRGSVTPGPRVGTHTRDFQLLHRNKTIIPAGNEDRPDAALLGALRRRQDLLQRLWVGRVSSSCVDAGHDQARGTWAGFLG